jgi:peptide/nickel transport system permease protein
VISGYFGGKVDLIIQRFVDAWIAFPAFILLIALISLLGPSLRNVIVVMSIAMAGGMSRILRSNVIVVKEASYVEMARVIGAGDVRIMALHVFPQIVPLILILASVQLGGVVLALASLGYLGFGIPQPTPEWGSMLSGRARDFAYSAYWLALFPGLAITLTVLSLNLFFDSLRDVIDPRMRGTGRR